MAFNIKTDPKIRFNQKWKINEKTGCWDWQATKFPSGYGVFYLKHKGQLINRAHRASYILHCGDIPKSKFICHTCDNPSCVNPEHLWAGTAKENKLDCILKGRAKYAKGSKLKTAKLNERQVDFIKMILQLNVCTQEQLANVFNVSRGAISYISRGRNWKHV
jgi:hypothetical protein